MTAPGRLASALVLTTVIVWTGSAQEDETSPPELTPEIIADIQSDLKERAKTDQEVRDAYFKAFKRFGVREQELADLKFKWLAVDRNNMAVLEEILDTWGWPGIAVFGKDTDRDAWLLLQHARYPLQKRGLVLLKEALGRGDTNPKNYAFLKDRLLVKECRCQEYGTQGSLDEKTGCPTLYPIKDLAGVEQRRRRAGMTSLREHMQKGYRLYAKETCDSTPPPVQEMFGALTCEGGMIRGLDQNHQASCAEKTHGPEVPLE